MGLYISVATASNELKNTAIDTAITRLAAATARLTRQGRIPATPSLDLTFLLPGKFEKPDFSGMRMGGYTRENGTLFFQAAVPDRLIDSDLTRAYLSLLLQDVVDNAADLFAANAVGFDAAHWRHLMHELGELAGASTPITQH